MKVSIMEDINKIAGQKMKRLRKQQKMSQARLAELVGTTPATISRWESGDVKIPLARLQKVANVLNVSVSELMPDASDPREQLNSIHDIDIKHIANQAAEDITQTMDFMLNQTKNRLGALASPEKLDINTFTYIPKTEDELLSNEQVEVIRHSVQDLEDIQARLHTAVDYWLEIICNKSEGKDNHITSDEHLLSESLHRQEEANVKVSEEARAKERSNRPETIRRIEKMFEQQEHNNLEMASSEHFNNNIQEGKELKKWRESIRLTQAQLARVINKVNVKLMSNQFRLYGNSGADKPQLIQEHDIDRYEHGVSRIPESVRSCLFNLCFINDLDLPKIEFHDDYIEDLPDEFKINNLLKDEK